MWHSGLTAGQCNAIEKIQKCAIRVIYSDTNIDYDIAFIVARIDSLKDRREILMVRFFKSRERKIHPAADTIRFDLMQKNIGRYHTDMIRLLC